MATFNKFDCFTKDLAEGIHDLSADALKVLLTDTLPTATDAVLTDIAEVAAGNGYTAGGNDAGATSSTQTSGAYTLIIADPQAWTASGGTVGPFRYAVLYNSTPPNGNLIGWWDYGSSVTLQSGESFAVDLDNTQGVLTIN